MKRTIPVIAALLALGLGAVAPALAGTADHHAPAASAAKKKKRKPATVKVGIADNYYFTGNHHTEIGGIKVKIHLGDKVKWVWPSDVGDTHDVNLGSGPAGLKPWASPAYAARANYTRTFTKTGTYQLYCSFHQGEMVMSVIVTK